MTAARRAALALSAVVAALIVLALAVAMPSRATATEPEPEPTPSEVCWEAGVNPRSPEARDCRERGWTVTRLLVVNPRGHARTGFEPCRFEDSRRCYWNARLRGNHHGRSFVNHGDLGTFYGLTRINGRRA